MTVGLQRLQHIFRSEKSNHRVRFAFRRLENVYDAHEDLKHLDRNAHEEIKNIVLDLSSQEAYIAIMRQLKSKIAEVGMNKFGRFLHGGSNLTGFDIIDHTSVHVKDFIKEWNNASKHNYPRAGERLMSDAALAVDSLQLVVESLKNLINNKSDIFDETFRRGKLYNYDVQGIPCNRRDTDSPEPRPWFHGKALMKALKSADFEGLTGKKDDRLQMIKHLI
ncbi:hypothetical protein KUTeg_024429 [Tegillarca granosa]|uniref:Receptor ligand binding region domain-containing protein n=1 Tax=Tegillarca granosa TaxID=220873 RepID=A0ABQ9E3M3_TEGGR|nr:hypothetical protein KUTeg_024429 [Tegillarca granosa]